MLRKLRLRKNCFAYQEHTHTPCYAKNALVFLSRTRAHVHAVHYAKNAILQWQSGSPALYTIQVKTKRKYILRDFRWNRVLNKYILSWSLRIFIITYV